MASLEQRVAAALAEPELPSESLVQLIAEVETAAQEADAAAAKARADALDPAVVVDAAKVGAAVVAAELTRDRMRVALSKLREQLKVARAREYADAWWEVCERVQGEVDALAQELAEVYPGFVARLVDILERARALDAEADRVNQRKPPGVGGWLRKVEQVARRVDGFGPNGLLSLMTELKLPKFSFDEGEDRYQFAWPTPTPSLVAQMAQFIAAPRGGVYGPDWQEQIKARNRELVAEVERAAAESEARQRVRGEREKAELKKAKEADRARWPA